uniref:Mcl1_mid domain-containing protein n=1 Tax=Panagrellus redivivus TaxID=6233 RepID=A0A7E4VSE9_PANRE
METDYSLQFRFIREHHAPFFHYGDRPKTTRLAISSTYGIVAISDTEGQLDSGFTDVLEKRQYKNPEVGRMWQEERDYDYDTKKSLPKPGCNSDGRVIAIDATTEKGSFIYLYDAAVLAPNLNIVAYAVNKIKLADPMPVEPVQKKSPKKSRWDSRSDSSRSEYYREPELKTKITTLEWNPIISHMFAAATDETLFIILFDLEDALNHRILAKTDTTAPITALSWNPVGTQLTVGDAEGRIYQFNPQLKLIRTVNPPDLIPSVFAEKFVCSGLCWVSKTERIVVFSSETSDKLHLTKLTVKPNKPPKWTIWDVLPAAESTEYGKTFTFLPVFKWNTVLMSSSCLSEVYTFGVVNNVWKPLKLDDRFTIKTPLYKGQKTFITSMSINYSSQKSVNIGSEFPNMPPQPVVYLTTTHDKVLVYHLVSLDANRPILFKPAQMIDKDNIKNGPASRESYAFYTDSDSDVQETNYFSERDSLDDSYSDDGDDDNDMYGNNYISDDGRDAYRNDYGFNNRKAKTRGPSVCTRKKGISTGIDTRNGEVQANLDDDDDDTSDEATILKLQEEIARLQESILQTNNQRAKSTCIRLRNMGKLSAAGVLEVYAAENERFHRIIDIGNRWTAMYRGDAKLVAEMKRLNCELSADEFVAAVLSTLDKPQSKKFSLDPGNSLEVEANALSEAEKTVLEVVCSAMTCKFVTV